MFQSILSLSLQQKIDMKNGMLRFSLTPAVCLTFAHINESVQTTPKISLLKDQETGVTDESPSDMDALLIDDMHVL